MSNHCECQGLSTELSAIGNSVSGTINCISVGKPARSDGAADTDRHEGLEVILHPNFRVVMVLLLEPHHSAGGANASRPRAATTDPVENGWTSPGRVYSSLSAW
ncbi:hypothetical protein BDB13_3772 [Rhodococcus sp. OK302]|nr:hypothetical protein BDB13_3772 [Rhodococcus sp. OK302]